MMTTGTPQKISDLRTTERVLVNRNRVCETVERAKRVKTGEYTR